MTAREPASEQATELAAHFKAFATGGTALVTQTVRAATRTATAGLPATGSGLNQATVAGGDNRSVAVVYDGTVRILERGPSSRAKSSPLNPASLSTVRQAWHRSQIRQRFVGSHPGLQGQVRDIDGEATCRREFQS